MICEHGLALRSQEVEERPPILPKVFLIDADEVSWRARADKVAPRQPAMRPENLVPPLPAVAGIRLL
jgi:hypothetical protein